MSKTFQEIERYCRNCGKLLVLKQTRDIERKRFCSRKCKVIAPRSGNKMSDPNYWRKYHFNKKYNVSYKDWVRMWTGQDGKCAICGESFANQSYACVDHDHETGEIRGLLCRKCNMVIGHFNDNPKLIMEAIKYLKTK